MTEVEHCENSPTRRSGRFLAGEALISVNPRFTHRHQSTDAPEGRAMIGLPWRRSSASGYDRGIMAASITITTGARLHFGPLSYQPHAGRHFGGVGVMIDQPGFRLRCHTADRDSVNGEQPTAGRVTAFVSQYRTACPAEHTPPPSILTIEQYLPPHSGLGSGTQLGLAVASGLATLAGEHNVDACELARRVGRGRRSAVGIHGFAHGGLIVDAGQSSGEVVGALACRLPLPTDWRVLLITPHEGSAGLAGEQEERAFESLGSMPPTLTDRLCRIVLTELLPAAHSAAFAPFAQAVGEYGRLVGEFFAPVQGGTFGHPRTDTLIARLARENIHGTGQTSWGPTVFAFVPNAATADQLVSTLTGEADVQTVAIRNTGAEVLEYTL